MCADGRCILLVDDSPEDAETTKRALRRAQMTDPIYHCADGDEALDFLRRRGRFEVPSSAPRPGLILLDLNIPGADGREVLREIKADAELKAIPVVVLTSSSDERDIENCYLAGANSYVRKPVDLPGFLNAIERLTDYWLDVVVLPNMESAL